MDAPGGCVPAGTSGTLLKPEGAALPAESNGRRPNAQTMAVVVALLAHTSTGTAAWTTGLSKSWSKSLFCRRLDPFKR
jgi:hypothetical protein